MTTPYAVLEEIYSALLPLDVKIFKSLRYEEEVNEFPYIAIEQLNTSTKHIGGGVRLLTTDYNIRIYTYEDESLFDSVEQALSGVRYLRLNSIETDGGILYPECAAIIRVSVEYFK